MTTGSYWKSYRKIKSNIADLISSNQPATVLNSTEIESSDQQDCYDQNIVLHSESESFLHTGRSSLTCDNISNTETPEVHSASVQSQVDDHDDSSSSLSDDDFYEVYIHSSCNDETESDDDLFNLLDELRNWAGPGTFNIPHVALNTRL